jgi:hypothetical protein
MTGSVPKFALPVGGASLLRRQVEQLAKAHRAILVSVATPTQAEHAEVALGHSLQGGTRIVVNPSHRDGPNHALRGILDAGWIEAPSVTITMGDLLFSENPFGLLPPTGAFVIVTSDPRPGAPTVCRSATAAFVSTIAWPERTPNNLEFEWTGAYGAPVATISRLLHERPIPTLEEELVEHLLGMMPVTIVETSTSVNSNEEADLLRANEILDLANGV